ncbi:MAG: ABC transporter ATP-binding protein, partial [Omnitrophica WOR_2 bacterium]
MQSKQAPQRAQNPRPPMNSKALLRAIRYLSHYRLLALLPYLFLVIATLAQLMVPRMVKNIIDAVTRGVIANLIVPKLSQIPSNFLSTLLSKLGTTQDQLTYDYNNAETMLIRATAAIILFALVRGLFAFLQAYWAERNSQSVAYDLRNELFAKIQSLSFSYHDRNQTGQLMIRATDDVEKVRLFIGQGLLMAVGALILLTGTLLILFTTNAGLTLIVLPILPVALILFLIFGAVAQPLFTRVQVRLSALNTILQENMAGIRVVKAFTREKSEEVKFAQSADNLMNQQITVARVFTFLFPVVFLIANLGQALVLYFGGKQILANTLTLGEWQEFSLYLVYVFFPIAQLGFIISQMSQASASAKRIFEILDAQSDVKDKPGA